MARLRRVDCSGPGITRRKRGKGFEYLAEDGNRVDDEEIVARIRALPIPPAWKDVWICVDPVGHIQATGVDAAERKQYRYHDRWRERRDREKFDSMLEFARALPSIRERVEADLGLEGMPRERALGCAVRLLERGFFRIGSEGYAEENETYGIATIRKRDVRSEDVNEYLRAATGGDFSAKDFRTWSATVLAAVALAVSGPAARASKTARKRAERRVVEEVAGLLGNTPAVARASYIDPRLFDRFEGGLTIGGVLPQLLDAEGGWPVLHGAVEDAVLDLIEREDSDAIERVA